MGPQLCAVLQPPTRTVAVQSIHSNMRHTFHALLSTMLTLGCHSGPAQNHHTMKYQTNPLLCDIETGLCELPSAAASKVSTDEAPSVVAPVRIIYYTDPICSSCWGIEPQLRRLKLEYGTSLEVEYRMGGLLPDWSYNSGGISKPADVAHHWDEVSSYYDMPIDGDVWLEDPLNSSYPSSIAFKAAQMQDPDKAVRFLRELREMVFLQKLNISRWEHLATAAGRAGLHVEQLRTDISGKAEQLFHEDLHLARELGVRGFPSVFFIDPAGRREFVYGSKPYEMFEAAVHKLAPDIAKQPYVRTWQFLFSRFSTLTAREFSELSGTPRSQSENTLNALVEQGILSRYTTKNGSIWKLR